MSFKLLIYFQLIITSYQLTYDDDEIHGAVYELQPKVCYQPSESRLCYGFLSNKNSSGNWYTAGTGCFIEGHKKCQLRLVLDRTEPDELIWSLMHENHPKDDPQVTLIVRKFGRKDRDQYQFGIRQRRACVESTITPNGRCFENGLTPYFSKLINEKLLINYRLMYHFFFI